MPYYQQLGMGWFGIMLVPTCSALISIFLEHLWIATLRNGLAHYPFYKTILDVA